MPNLNRAEHVARLMQLHGITEAAAEARVTRVNAASRRGHKLLANPDSRVVAAHITTRAKPQPKPEPTRRPSRTAWTRAGRIYMRRMFIDRNNMAVYRGSDEQVYSQAMLEANVEQGSMRIVSRRKTRTGETVTVLARRI